jgi:hypothetical protein
MKTSVGMVRKMGNFDIIQRTKDGYFDANFLLNQWNSIKTNPERKMIRFLESPKTKEFIEEISLDSPSAEMHDGLVVPFHVKKGRNTSKGKTKDEIWMHPYLFIDFAMWINPKFKLSVIKFVYDQLIQERKLAGDNYLMLSSSGVKLKGYNFSEVAKAIQWIVYGKTGKGLRQTATEEQLKELNEIQIKFSFAIDMGYIKSYSQLLEEMREMYRIKKRKTPF